MPPAQKLYQFAGEKSEASEDNYWEKSAGLTEFATADIICGKLGALVCDR
jgi:hypothetical protein